MAFIKLMSTLLAYCHHRTIQCNTCFSLGDSTAVVQMDTSMTFHSDSDSDSDIEVLATVVPNPQSSRYHRLVAGYLNI